MNISSALAHRSCPLQTEWSDRRLRRNGSSEAWIETIHPLKGEIMVLEERLCLAILHANDSAGPATLTFSPSVFAATITLTTPLPGITGNGAWRASMGRYAMNA
jgi:hypothetical protein